jgi:hypothetical protein
MGLRCQDLWPPIFHGRCHGSLQSSVCFFGHAGVFRDHIRNAQSSSIHASFARLPERRHFYILDCRLRRLLLLRLLCLIARSWLGRWSYQANILWLRVARVDCYYNDCHTRMVDRQSILRGRFYLPDHICRSQPSIFSSISSVALDI